jgi:hypothetical protein
MVNKGLVTRAGINRKIVRKHNGSRRMYGAGPLFINTECLNGYA